MRIVKPLLKIALSLILIAIVVRAFDVRGVVAQFMKVDAATLLLATAVALATSQGDFGLAMALGLVLLALALTVNVLLQLFQGHGAA